MLYARSVLEVIENHPGYQVRAYESSRTRPGELIAEATPPDNARGWSTGPTVYYIITGARTCVYCGSKRHLEAIDGSYVCAVCSAKPQRKATS